MSESLDATLRRLKDERDEADRLYNEALTALDRALPPPAALPDPQAPLDEHQLGALNEAWNILAAPPVAARGLRGRLTGLIWRTVGPYLQRQLAFNSVLVDHINRSVDAQRAAHRRDVEAAAALRAHLDGLAGFHARLLAYVQQVTGYVDTKDRDTAGGALVLNAALSDLAEGQAKYRESLTAREHRSEARMTALGGSLSRMQEEFRVSLGVAQHAIATLKRHVEGTHAEGAGGVAAGAGTPARSAEPAPPAAAPAPSASATARSASSPAPSAPAFAPSLDAYKYVGFEDQFRGSQAVIRERQESYVPYFQGVTADVLDVGCGRGEFIDLLVGHGIPARGIDLNHEMAELCRARGLNVAEADAVDYLSSQPDGSLGGLFAAQVVEHLEPGYLLRFLDLAFLKLQPGGRLVLETLNPACWTAFFESYIRDITHRWPLHPETLQYLVRASGFSGAEIEFRSPVPPEDRLQLLEVPAGADGQRREMADTFNANVEKLNARMFTYLDYAIVARTGGGVR